MNAKESYAVHFPMHYSLNYASHIKALLSKTLPLTLRTNFYAFNCRLMAAIYSEPLEHLTVQKQPLQLNGEFFYYNSGRGENCLHLMYNVGKRGCHVK